jgi:hypothetical protein
MKKKKNKVIYNKILSKIIYVDLLLIFFILNTFFLLILI